MMIVVLADLTTEEIMTIAGMEEIHLIMDDSQEPNEDQALAVSFAMFLAIVGEIARPIKANSQGRLFVQDAVDFTPLPALVKLDEAEVSLKLKIRR